MAHRPPAQRQIAEHPGGQLADESGPQQELVAGDVGLGGSLAQGLAEQLAHAHEGLPSEAMNLTT